MTFYDRLVMARTSLDPRPTQWRIVWENPDEPDDPLKITGPSPEFMAALMAGGVMPPVDVINEAVAIFEVADKLTDPLVKVRMRDYARALRDTAEPLGPLTEQQALEYVLMKDVPASVWGRPHNRPMFAITTADKIPTDRSSRNAWRLSTFLDEAA